uniref:Metalloendopeptidase n=1 Tax=Ceriantheomorphe brasiliensis TaxID=1048506 RepID=A0A7G7WYR5_9CNID|nr:toxin candidate TRINITY_DN21784_c8_g1_i1 [Ceriantheomorphe brasiliensis]
MIFLILVAISLANARPQAADIGNSGSTNNLHGDILKLSSADEIFNDALPEENLDHQPAFWEGDIILTDFQKQFYSKMSSELTYKKALIKDNRKLWPDKTVPYIFASEIDAEGKEIVDKAITHWKQHSCMDFVPRTTQKDYVEFVFLGGCASYVGKIGGKQIISIGSLSSKCKVGNLIHELGHCIGFFHEQSRPDRKRYVKVIYDNIKPGYQRNFMRMNSHEVDSRNVPYDYGSIMHYPKNFFSKTPDAVTLQILKDTHGTYVGQRIALSDLDILQAKVLYSCTETPTRTHVPRNGKCEDKHDKETCDFLKGKGYCKRFSQSMHKICSSTCGICKKPAHN